MCSPLESGLFATEAYGEYAAGAAEARLHRLNAHFAEQSARAAIASGEHEVGRVREQAAQITGTQRAGYSGQNVLVGTGSALQAQVDTAAVSEQDVRAIRINAAHEAWGYRAEAIQERYAAKSSRQAGVSRAAATLIGRSYDAGAFSKGAKKKELSGGDIAGIFGGGG